MIDHVGDVGFAYRTAHVLDDVDADIDDDRCEQKAVVIQHAADDAGDKADGQEEVERKRQSPELLRYMARYPREVRGLQIENRVDDADDDRASLLVVVGEEDGQRQREGFHNRLEVCLHRIVEAGVDRRVEDRTYHEAVLERAKRFLYDRCDAAEGLPRMDLLLFPVELSRIREHEQHVQYIGNDACDEDVLVAAADEDDPRRDEHRQRRPRLRP